MIPAGLDVAEVALRADLRERDDLLRSALAAAAAFCQTRTARTLSPSPARDTDPPVTVARRLHGSRYIRVPDLRRLASLMIDGQAVDVADVDLIRRPDRLDVPAHKLAAPIAGERAVVVGWFGFDEIPYDLADAIYTDAARRAQDNTGGYPDPLTGGGDGVVYPKALSARVQAVYVEYRIRDDLTMA